MLYKVPAAGGSSHTGDLLPFAQSQPGCIEAAVGCGKGLKNGADWLRMRTFISGSSSGRAPAAALADNELSRTSSCHQPADAAIEAAMAAHLDRLLCSRCSSPQSMPAQRHATMISSFKWSPPPALTHGQIQEYQDNSFRCDAAPKINWHHSRQYPAVPLPNLAFAKRNFIFPPPTEKRKQNPGNSGTTEAKELPPFVLRPPGGDHRRATEPATFSLIMSSRAQAAAKRSCRALAASSLLPREQRFMM